jgi:hypothetical protein
MSKKIILVTGDRGSGKTTALADAMAALKGLVLCPTGMEAARVAGKYHPVKTMDTRIGFPYRLMGYEGSLAIDDLLRHGDPLEVLKMATCRVRGRGHHLIVGLNGDFEIHNPASLYEKIKEWESGK